jgi:Ca-activated chloride channel family protein
MNKVMRIRKDYRKIILFGVLLHASLQPQWLFAQQNQEVQLPVVPEAQTALSSGATHLAEGSFAQAEADYRKALALGERENGAFNLGNEYHLRGQNKEALFRFKQAAKDASTYEHKHRAFHNLGNAFMKEKMYQEAVEAYKDALRSNPQDDESRYNLAVAQDLLEKNPPPQDENKDDKKDQEEKEDQNQQDQQDQDGENNKDPNQNDENQDNQDNQDQQDQGDDQKDPKDQKGDEQGNNQNQNNQKQDQQPQQPKPGQLSPQQIKNLLEAMNNEEQKVQDKMNLQKAKGAKVKRSKDW